ncbi:hypothetical protein ACLB0R_00030 [Sphingomonas sp. GlSt437]|uniref:hypothetical protein n=1 Tax=Sphingomonas sp. GlSt437 TaxID=3389970 RepID=UPI003A86EE77
MIVRVLTSLPLAAIGLLWFFASVWLTRSLPSKPNAIDMLWLGALPVGVAAFTFWALWYLRAPTAERAATRIVLAGFEGFWLFFWVGTMLGWGGGV